MIKSIELLNFQGHAYSYLELHKGVNVIRGTSHAGKSSIIRALQWCLFNRPRGEGFKSHFAKKKDPVEVTIVFTDDTYITRKKWYCKDEKRILNSYISDAFQFHAVKSDVPEEVKELTRMTEINFQGQGDRHFLLHESPGTVGKKLSEAVGLQIIDEVKGKLNKVYNDTLTRQTINKEDTEKAEEGLKKHEGLNDIGLLVGSIQAHIGNKDKFEHKFKRIKNILHDLDIKQINININETWLEVEGDYHDLLGHMKELDILYNRYNRINETLIGIGTGKNNIKRKSLLLKADSKLKSLKKMWEELSILRFKHDKIEDTVSDMQKHKKRRETTSSLLSEMENKRAELKKALNFCQYCGADKKNWRN